MIETAVLTKNASRGFEVPTWSLAIRTEDDRVFDAHVENLDLKISAHIIPTGAEVTLSFITTTLREVKGE